MLNNHTMQLQQTLVNGKKLAYFDNGEGPVVVLVHGFGEDSRVWAGQVTAFAGYRLLVPDLPGSGASEAVDDMSMEGLAAVLHRWLEGLLSPDEKFALVGHSMGGYITLAYAERWPGQLAGWGLFHSSAFADPAEKKAVRQKGIAFAREHGAPAFFKTSTANLYAPSTREERPQLIDEQLTWLRNFSTASLVSYYEAMMNRPDRTSVLQQASVPVLLVLGRHDTAVPFEDGLKQTKLPQLSYIHVLERSGHMGMREEEQQANAILSGFVSGVHKTNSPA